MCPGPSHFSLQRVVTYASASSDRGPQSIKLPLKWLSVRSLGNERLFSWSRLRQLPPMAKGLRTRRIRGPRTRRLAADAHAAAESAY